ncbi:semaphorin-4B-like [Huso huso]|uniref:Semaphorin-4B-like n=1 Tax=Huso huso TaxID=61971 RepID=A0ABR0YX66_HUSHU
MWTIAVDYLLLLAGAMCAAGSIQAASTTEDDVTPRISFQYNDKERTAKRFSAEGVFNYTSLLLNENDQVLYVGAREALFALNISDFGNSKLHKNLTWKTPDHKRNECGFKGRNLQTDCFNYIKIFLQLNSTHLYVCGTYAFSPLCAYISISDFSLVKNTLGDVATEDGRGRCPFDPEYKSTAIMVDGELYSGTVSNFQGNEPTIFKSLGPGTPIKTENSLNWLQDPAFVGSAYIQESLPKGNPVGDDDKIYFFFSEAGKEFDFFDNTIVSRIARVCKGDVGGERVLQKRWTTFLKAHLLCSLPDDGFPFNIIQDMYVLTPGKQDWKSTVFYGVFTSQWYKGAAGSSAVCAFTMEQVENAFNGRYREVNRETQHWYTYNHPVPEPRPGACITNAARKMDIPSSRHMPDKVLNFVKDHFLMDGVIRSQPLLLKRNARYTQIAVHRVQGIDQAYDVLFLGTDDGKLHKAINVNNKMHIIEEMELFDKPQPVQNIILDSKKGLLYISSYSGLVEVPVANCSNYQSCGECVLSRDPYCAWSGRRCRDVRQASPNSRWKQDVEDAHTAPDCNGSLASPRTVKTTVTGESQCQTFVLPPNTFKILPCKLRSNLATRKWVYSPSASNSTYVSPDGGLVVVANAEEKREAYECWSIEGGFRQLLANYCVEAETTAMENTPSTTSTSITRTTTLLIAENKYVLLHSENRSAQDSVRTYWNELLIMCILLGVTLLCFALFLIYRNRHSMKTFLKEGECSSMQQKKQRMAGKPAESLPLNGSTMPTSTSTSDHKGYQTLNDNYICSTPTHGSPDHSKEFMESEKRPLNLKESHVEISPTCHRPRVRLGSEIRDSIV